MGAGNSAPQDKKYFTDGTIPFFRTADVGRVHFSTDLSDTGDFLNKKAVDELGLKVWPKNTILFPKSGASTFLNHRVMISIEGVVSSHLATIFTENDILQKYIFYFLTTIDAKTLTADQGYPSLRISDLQKIKIPLPPLNIQKQIVERLDKIAEAQKLNDDLIQKSDELFQSLLHKELNPAGKDWEIKNLEDIAKIIMGQSPSSTSYNESGHGLPFFQGKADFGELYPNTVKYCSAPSGIAEPEDILISVRAPVGDINLAKCKSCIGRGLAAIRGNTKIVEQMLLYFIFKKNEKNWQRQSTGSTFAAITKDKLTDYKIPLPPLEVQKQIVAKLSAVQEYKAQLLAQKSKLKELFDSVLAKSFSQ